MKAAGKADIVRLEIEMLLNAHKPRAEFSPDGQQGSATIHKAPTSTPRSLPNYLLDKGHQAQVSELTASTRLPLAA